MTSAERIYNILKQYGEIIVDKNHETIEGNFIRFITFKSGKAYFIVTMFNGDVMAISETNNVHNLMNN